MRWWVVVAMLVLMVEARRRKPGGTCGLSCYRSLFKKAQFVYSRFHHITYQTTIFILRIKSLFFVKKMPKNDYI